MKITLTGTGQPGLDGEYEISPEPTVREITRFRKESGISPSEMTEILSVGAIEVVPFYVYTAMHRDGRVVEASTLIDLPFDTWGNAAVTRDAEPEAVGDGDEAEDETQLPPADGSGSSGSERSVGAASGTTSLEPSELPA